MHRELIKALIAENFGILPGELNHENIEEKCLNHLSCLTLLRKLNTRLDFRKNADIISTYIISQVYLQDKFEFSHDEVLIINSEYPNKFNARIPDWNITTDVSDINNLLNSDTIESGLVLKRYPDGVKTYFVIDLETLKNSQDNGYQNAIIERKIKLEFQNLV